MSPVWRWQTEESVRGLAMPWPSFLFSSAERNPSVWAEMKSDCSFIRPVRSAHSPLNAGIQSTAVPQRTGGGEEAFTARQSRSGSAAHTEGICGFGDKYLPCGNWLSMSSPCHRFPGRNAAMATALARAAQPGESPLCSRDGGEGSHGTDRRSGGAEGSLPAPGGKSRALRQYKVSFFLTASGINSSDSRQPDDAKFQPDPQPASRPRWKSSPPPLP